MHPQALFHHPQLPLVPRHLYENGYGQHYCMVPEGYTPVLVPNGPPPGSLPPPPQQQPTLQHVGSPFAPHSGLSFTAPPYTTLVDEALQQQQQQAQPPPPAPQSAIQTLPLGSPSTQSVPSKPPEVPKRIPRPSNSFMTYRMEKQHEVLAHHAGANNKDISVIIGDMWRNESEPVKEYYRKKAELGRQEHALKYPDYKYTALKPRKVSSASAAVVAAAIAVGVDISGQVESAAPPKVTKATKKRSASKSACDAANAADPNDSSVVAGKAKRVANRGASADAASSSHTSAAAAVAAAAAVNAVRAARSLRRTSIKKSRRQRAGGKGSATATHTAIDAADTVSGIAPTEAPLKTSLQEALVAAQIPLVANNCSQQHVCSVSAQTSPLLIDTASLGRPRLTAAIPTTTCPYLLLSSSVESAQSVYPSSVSSAHESAPIMDPDPSPLWMAGLQRDDLTSPDAFTDNFLEALQIPTIPTEHLVPSP
ncbi:hypothetical protein HDU87_007545 [Geranomyces variabilis]|uniref:HMG box domain-containing protein n=1 Tax=Geranomyces variabilis TaxID=109894 RepID=A0AAD5TPL6_9FUNG|nr:hypothetical protein HDU87_007545 [Geranomyces variabilis]